jgi:hypothetical protein
MRVAARFWVFSGIALLTLSAQVASANCRLYLAQGPGFSLSLKTPETSGNDCKSGEIDLELLVGSQSLKIKPVGSWQVGTTTPTVYTVTAVLTNTEAQGPGGDLQGLTLSSGSTTQSTSMNAVYTPASGTIAASYEQDVPGATPAYVVRQRSLSLSGVQDLTLQPNGGSPVPMQLIDLAQGPAPWFTSLPQVKSPFGTTTVTATFQLDPADPTPTPTANPPQPYIDTYGQALAWTGRISKPSDLNATVAAEQTWLQQNQGLSNLDQYGGIPAAWSHKTTGYYDYVFHADHWFLVSPLGNPLFFLGVTSIDAYSTPIDTRGGFFDSLPPDNKLFGSAYSAKGAAFSFIVANQLRKYCQTDENNCVLPVPPPARAACPNSPCSLTEVSTDLETVRFASWAFTGEGKVFSQATLVNNPLLPRPSFPVLEHDATKLPSGFFAVCNLVSHPDPFDPQTVMQLDAALRQQIGSHVTDPNVVGWSMGNENAEIIDSSEIGAILQKAGTVPAKQSLMLHALNDIYKGRYAALDGAWGISATTEQQLYDAVPNVNNLPTQDVENLREFYEDAYYKLFRDRVKHLDQNHLYFGSWILSGDPTLQYDWPIAAKYSDVVGFDDFSPGPLSSDLIQLFKATHKPVLLGAWGVLSDYGGTRGFGWNQYTDAMTLSDSASGDAYAAKLASLAESKYVVGAMLFDYYDEPLTGRGPGSGADLVIGEDFAFGLLDTTDTPKYDFVNKVRAANCAALATLGLATCP